MPNNKRIIVTLPKYLRKKLEEYASKNECSQAEIIRLGLIKLIEEEKHDPSK